MLNAKYFFLLFASVIFFENCNGQVDNLSHTQIPNNIHRTDRFIDYVFPYEIDSLLTIYYRNSKQEHPYIKIAFPTYSGLHLVLFLDNNAYYRSLLKPDSLGSHFGNSENIFYQYSNRYAVINKGEFYVPIVFGLDNQLSPVGDRRDFTRRTSSTGWTPTIEYKRTDPSEWEIDWGNMKIE